MTIKPKYLHLLNDDNVRKWYENLNVKSYLTATTWLRTLGYYCELKNTTPEKILVDMRDGSFRNSFEEFVRMMEKKGKAGTYIRRFKNTLRSYAKFNDIRLELNINIAGERQNPTIEDERVPSKDELAKMLRMATLRGRVAISLMAYSGLRPESLGNYTGTDGLRLKDLNELKIGEKIEFEKVPTVINVKSLLSKARHRYFTFIGDEGVTYIREYLEERIKQGENLTPESPLLQFDGNRPTKNQFLRTTLLTRDIREAIRGAGLKMRPYVLRAYFSTALDIAESKGFISHPWRQFIMGHKGDIEARYSTNKRLPPDIIEEMRESYKKCTRYLETKTSETSESDAKLYLQQQLLLAVGYKQDEIDRMNLADMENESFQKLLKDKITTTMSGNGSKQKLVDIKDIEGYLEKGYEFQASLPNGKAVMRLPF
jgi:hypothetical protein